MINKSKKRTIVFLFIVASIIYFGFWLFQDIPPKVNPDINHYKTYTLKKFSKEETSKMWQAYEASNFIKKSLFWKYLRARDRALLKYCLENNLGDNIGGGCQHYVGSYNANDTFHALEYSGISWE